jgi:hypothetical protein
VSLSFVCSFECQILVGIPAGSPIKRWHTAEMAEWGDEDDMISKSSLQKIKGSYINSTPPIFWKTTSSQINLKTAVKKSWQGEAPMFSLLQDQNLMQEQLAKVEIKLVDWRLFSRRRSVTLIYVSTEYRNRPCERKWRKTQTFHKVWCKVQ